MFQNVLVVDDHDAIIQSERQVLQELGVSNITNAQYADEAFLKYKRAKMDQNPFDLVITDLSFKPDHRNITLESGEDLIASIRDTDQNTPIAVYSMKDQLQKVRLLVEQYQVNAYVLKDRRGMQELSMAIKKIKNNERFLSPQIERALHPANNLEIDDLDILLLELLSKGYSQDQISKNLKQQNKTPSSLSSVEKRLNKLRVQFKANNAIHLVAQAKDLGLI